MGAVRVAEESRGRVVMDNSASLIVNKAQYLSSHIPHISKEAKETTFVQLERCAQMSYNDLEPCLCVVDACVHWYPCSLKYCRNNSGDTGEHRCGIRTCSKCTEMRFTARSKHVCSWDEL